MISILICFIDYLSSKIQITVNGGSPVDSGAVLSVGDVLSCSAEGALSYRWTNLHNDSDEETYGKTVRVSQAGSFKYQCTVFVQSGTGLACPVTINIIGYAIGITLNVFGPIRDGKIN